MATVKRRRPAKRAQKGRGRKPKSESLGWRRSPITGVIAILVILFCLYNLFNKNDSYMSRYKSDYVCRECGEVMRISYIQGNTPHECPKCKKKELYTALNCQDCDDVTAKLPPFRDFTCNACDHHEEVRLDPTQGPHECPKCGKLEFFETYECISCDHVFGRDTSALKESSFENIILEDEEFMSEEFFFDEFFFDEFAVTCPKCNKPEALPMIQDPIATCEHCDSENLKLITPVEVIKYEFGRKLTEREQKKVDQWLEKNDN